MGMQWCLLLTLSTLPNVVPHPVIGKHAVHPLGEGFLLDGHPLLLQLPDPPRSILRQLHPGSADQRIDDLG